MFFQWAIENDHLYLENQVYYKKCQLRHCVLFLGVK